MAVVIEAENKDRFLALADSENLEATVVATVKAKKRLTMTWNGNSWAIEGITSPDGRVFGKMGHSERIGKDLYRNVLGEYDIKMFASMVKYFKG